MLVVKLLQHIPMQAAENLQEVVADHLNAVADLMTAHHASGVQAVDKLVTHVELYRGKMLRPALTLIAGLAAHPETKLRQPAELVNNAHTTVAAVLETIHLATLVHDDVLDEAAIRRSHPTLNRLTGNERAVILGDYLFARAYHLCSTLQDQRVALRVGEVTTAVCTGEMLQLTSRGDAELTEDQYYAIIDGKTAALIAAAAELGAHASGASADICHRLSEFGRRLGQAFQIQDDLLDLTGDEKVVGKSLGKDIEKGKLTLPVIHHLSVLEAAERDLLAKRIQSAKPLNGERLAVVNALHETGSIQYATTKAHSLIESAKALLEPLPASPAHEALLAMADAAINRSA